MDYNSRKASRKRTRLGLPNGEMTAAAAAAKASEVFQECGCKGIRTCLICERQRQVDPPWQLSPKKTHRFLYCVDTGWAVGAEDSDFEGWAFPFPGVTLIEDFVTREEEAEMVRLMDCDPWKLSQSGRRKQDYGPRVNFRKQKLKTAGFLGLPSFSREVVQRMGLYPSLEDFQPVEQCNLDYSPERGSAIDPHLDDAWLWGERLVSLNLLSPTVMSMSQKGPGNLLLSSAPPASPKDSVDSATAPCRSVPCQDVEVAIPVPRRSLLVLAGAARHQWTHGIHRRHIKARRVCATFRELSAEFRPGGRQQDLGFELLQISCSFQGRPV
ncbi:alpha-ketoglutarate-dependent dioxygenase alkB homolog 4 [Heterocephalus glaber]|uniref:Alpha-ketoglutarate-dependent dioxygenase alkB homolog 4 n=1 Tax=Heterocephalus glaber TaxID=10181 RepID=A0A0P6J9F0_HETGA|nr:alpha-ketoglutarate-dependent dioxygenase alkB homolog 4 [Heterocephalus glaber]